MRESPFEALINGELAGKVDDLGKYGKDDVRVAFSRFGGVYYIHYFIVDQVTNSFLNKLEPEPVKFSKTTLPYIRQKIEKELDKYEIYPPNNAPTDPDKGYTHVSYKLEQSQIQNSLTLFRLVNRTVLAEYMNHMRGY